MGSTDLEGALAGTAIVLVLSVGFLLYLRGLGRGLVSLTAAGLVVQTSSGKQIYNWKHITRVEIEGRTFPSTNTSDAIVKISLSRSYRLGLLPGRQGTDVVGIPTLIVRSVRLHMEDADGFMAAVTTTQDATRGW
jgi:hypothetical protein